MFIVLKTVYNMLKRGTNIFERDKNDWESWVESLLWYNIVYHKNEYSGCDLIVNDAVAGRGYRNGDIVGDTRILSYYIGDVKRLTWKELALALGFFKDHLTSDGHDCEKCEERETCRAFFKDDKDQERCSGWMEKHGKPDDEKEYRKFIDDLMSTRTGELLSIEHLKQIEEYLKYYN